MVIRPAAAADLPAIAAIYDSIIAQEEAGGPIYTNWQRGKYPTEDTARQALEAGHLYVGEKDGALWGVVTLNNVQLTMYDTIPWSLSAEQDQVGVIHTLCILPSQAGQGYAKKMVSFCEEESRRQGRIVMRLDTWVGNLPANRLYPSLGYRFAGSAETLFMGVIHETLNCYEKPL